ncbi:hypothetical protein HMPREF9244_00607 [Alloscardovia omnicolens F0580]|uniref:Uncharacterized protein n=1 Tax=Alloscardovia omnicolens F0580 TaxID=1321816 RepID=U1QUS5_9BIFI|nr:hypothetical protein HMPREF9244_00607 [Alloscardovia omnicolens F0580]
MVIYNLSKLSNAPVESRESTGKCVTEVWWGNGLNDYSFAFLEFALGYFEDISNII